MLRRLAMLLAAGCLLPAVDARADDGQSDGLGVEVLVDDALTARLHDLLVDSPAAGGHVRLRLLLPARFDEEPDRRWPVLYLLHGGNDDYRSWTDKTDVEGLTEDLDVIVVMPDSGRSATYADWYNGGAFGPPAYETHHLVEVRELLEERYRSNGRYAVAGLSSGGYGAMSYAGRHPDLFRAAASFSGNLDIREGDLHGYTSALLQFAIDGGGLFGPWGEPTIDEVRWRAHNPLDLAPNLAGVSLYVAGGNGVPGPLDAQPSLGIPVDQIEAATERRSRAFLDRLHALGIPVVENLYGPGTHTWPYWERELGAALPLLLDALSSERPAPPSFAYRSAEDAFSVWGWEFFVTERSGLAFTDVAVDGDRIAATGNGRLHVRTPAAYEPGARYRVGSSTVVADGAGRLSFALWLGASAEQYTPLPDPPGPRPAGPPRSARIEAA